jgi:putative ABC transport system permease protein
LASISLIVGGIGIMNAMITSVMERTKEIGLLKALGASNNKILSLFLLESAFIGLIGGIIGILIGFGLVELIAFIGTQSGFALVAVKNFEIIFGALAFSMIVGMLSGFYPALRASKLDPVEALRYE